MHRNPVYISTPVQAMAPAPVRPYTVTEPWAVRAQGNPLLSGVNIGLAVPGTWPNPATTSAWRTILPTQPGARPLPLCPLLSSGADPVVIAATYASAVRGVCYPLEPQALHDLRQMAQSLRTRLGKAATRAPALLQHLPVQTPGSLVDQAVRLDENLDPSATFLATPLLTEVIHVLATYWLWTERAGMWYGKELEDMHADEILAARQWLRPRGVERPTPRSTPRHPHGAGGSGARPRWTAHRRSPGALQPGQP